MVRGDASVTDDASAPVLWWHGGPAGLSEILPPTVTGVKPAKDYIDDEAVNTHIRDDQVYCVNSPAWAAIYAVLSSKTPSIYLVTPHLPILPDPDLVTHGDDLQSVMAPKATIIHEYVLTAADKRFWLAQALQAVQRHTLSMDARGLEQLVVRDAIAQMMR